MLGDLWGVTTKVLVHWGTEIEMLKANGGAKEKRVRLNEQLICQSSCFYMGFYAEQISVSVKSTGP